jgi:L-cysteine S-thiosulfotransferase
MKRFAAFLLAAAAAPAFIAPPAIADDPRAAAVATLQRDFKARGITTLNLLVEDGVQAICNRTDDKPPKEVAQRLEQDQLAGIKWPGDGRLLGDWKSGERIAQNGRGMTWSDSANAPGGGSCYNCHQIGPQETSFGTIGPSLFQFGKVRGYGPDIQRYVYGKIYNAKAYSLCSQMPRFGHVGALSEQQIKDLVALLLDPASPVNK